MLQTQCVPFDAIVLAGGSARRLGGIDKPGLVVGGVSLLDRVLAGCVDADHVVVVGSARPTCREVVWTSEVPRGGGPVPALAAGLREVTADVVLLLAADLPRFSADCAALLIAQAPCLLTSAGRPQWLCSAWSTEDLRRASQSATSARLGDLLRPLSGRELMWSGEGRPWEDCDDWDDVRRLEAELAG